MVIILGTKSYSLPEAKIEQFEIQPPMDVEKLVVGIDPGTVHLGIAVSAPHRTSLLFEITMRRDDYHLTRMLSAQKILHRLMNFLDETPVVIIEGAAFSEHFRQVELAEQRAAISLWFSLHYGANVYEVAPSSILKQAFGNTKKRAYEIWPELPKNAAAALACSFYPLDRVGVVV